MRAWSNICGKSLKPGLSMGHLRYYVWVGSSLTCKYETRLKMHSRYKLCSLTFLGVFNEEKGFT